MGKTSNIGLRFEPGDADMVRRGAAAMGMTISEFVRISTRAYIEADVKNSLETFERACLPILKAEGVDHYDAVEFARHIWQGLEDEQPRTAWRCLDLPPETFKNIILAKLEVARRQGKPMVKTSGLNNGEKLKT